MSDAVVCWNEPALLEWCENPPVLNPVHELIRPDRARHFDTLAAALSFAARLTFDQLLTATLTTTKATYGADEIASLTERPDIPEI